MAKALAKDPGDRYPTCGELVEAAARALGVSRAGEVAMAALAVVAIAAVVGIAVVAGLLARARARQPRRLLGLPPKAAPE